ncbi:unnamed protein product [Adineta steineri]|uniref:F-box domain-containing protein n=1 Tax=Adineta steineri TaxID=433720 RepID=A0A814BIV3_9BILA|nr:unnamed protein product [Adineta steineri]CAF3781602.1 unnamed protein product [Adineta steineri]
MYLELLPNELLFNIFQHLSTPDVLRAFLQLNHRFDELVGKHLYTCEYIDLRTTSKFNFDLFWKQYLAPLADIIWSLSNLVYFRCNTYFGSELAFDTPKVTSPTIKSVYGFRDDWNTSISNLLRHTPQIRCLSINMVGCSRVIDLPTNITSITKLDLLSTKAEFSSLVNFLRRTPNLTYLKLDMIYIAMPAQAWEKLIQKYLTNLKTLHFKMNFIAAKAGSTGAEQVEQIVNTFRNPFWLDEHRWFVQCDWSPITEKCYVYTLPYAFENFNIDFPICFESTCAINSISCFCDRFSNIQHITIDLTDAYRFRYKNGQNDSSTYDCERRSRRYYPVQTNNSSILNPSSATQQLVKMGNVVNNQKIKRRDIQFVTMLLVQDIVFIISTFPISIHKLYSIATIHETKSKLRQ